MDPNPNPPQPETPTPPPTPPVETTPWPPTPMTPAEVPPEPDKPAKEPIDTVKTGDQGRPTISEEQYLTWLQQDLRPWLENACSLYYACQKSGLERHYGVIYKKYKLKDWFYEKVEAYRSIGAELANESYLRLIRQINDRIKREEKLSKEDLQVLEHFTSKHRTAQTFFGNRVENADAKAEDAGHILDTIESTNYGEFGSEAKKQVLENDPPVQDQG